MPVTCQHSFRINERPGVRESSWRKDLCFHRRNTEIPLCQTLTVTTVTKVFIGFSVHEALSHVMILLVSFSLLPFAMRRIGITVVLVGIGSGSEIGEAK